MINDHALIDYSTMEADQGSQIKHLNIGGSYQYSQIKIPANDTLFRNKRLKNGIRNSSHYFSYLNTGIKMDALRIVKPNFPIW